MSERPILFTAPMVRAILNRTKTQTRRIIKPQPASVEYWRYGRHSDRFEGIAISRDSDGKGWSNCGPFRCPYIADGMYSRLGGKLGNSNREDFTIRKSILWVRETFRPIGSGYEYRATVPALTEHIAPWKPSIFMPRAACRIRLEIQSVRVERLQDITEDDAIAEGCTTDFNHSADCSNDDCALCGDPEDCDGVVVTARENYMALWETLNGPNSWSANPYVWVITFKPVTPFA